MSSIFSIFDVGVRGMFAQQTALNVTGQNIANANTENYVRQRANLKESTPFDAYPGQLGTGVIVESITRLKDEFTDFQIIKENQNLGYLEEKSDILQQLENIFHEPSDKGINSLISGFYDSLQDLSNHPENFSARVMVKEKALALSDAFNRTISRIEELKSNLNENISYKVNKINAMSSEIATLNSEISKTEVGGMQNANDLRNQRDALVRSLSKMGNIYVQEADNKMISVQLGDKIIVSGVYPVRLATRNTAGNTLEIVSENTNERVHLTNGSLKALTEIRDQLIPQYAQNMDTLAKAIIEEINDVHVGGVGLNMYQTASSDNSVNSANVPLTSAGLDGSMAGGNFTLSLYDINGILISENSVTINPLADSLQDVANTIDALAGFNASVTQDNKLSISASTSTDQFSFVGDTTYSKDSSGFLKAIGLNTFFKGSSASNITVTDTIVNDVNKIATGKSASPGDNLNIIDLAGTRETTAVSGATFEDYYSSMVGELGIERQTSLNRYETQDMILNTLQERQQAESGVSFDEEAVNLIRFQRGYQASAKFITVIDGLIGSLLQMV